VVQLPFYPYKYPLTKRWGVDRKKKKERGNRKEKNNKEENKTKKKGTKGRRNQTREKKKRKKSNEKTLLLCTRLLKSCLWLRLEKKSALPLAKTNPSPSLF
jgi:hypothetical protein